MSESGALWSPDHLFVSGMDEPQPW